MELINLEEVKTNQDMKQLSLEKYLNTNLHESDNGKWCCPWHEDKHPSLIMTLIMDKWKVLCPVCGCDRKGTQDIVDVHKKLRLDRDGVFLNFQEAKDELFSDNSLFLSTKEVQKMNEVRDLERAKKLKEEPKWISMDLKISKAFKSCNPLQEHFLKRGITAETINNVNPEDLEVRAIRCDSCFKGKSSIVYYSKNNNMLWKKPLTKTPDGLKAFNRNVEVVPVLVRVKNSLNTNTRVTIVEGIEDALSIIQLSGYKTDAISLNGLNNSNKLLQKDMLSKLAKYNSIELLLDNDSHGQKETIRLLDIMVNNHGLFQTSQSLQGAQLVESNCNDINEYLVNLGI